MDFLNAEQMKTYKIPITWQSYKTYEVESENLEEAVEKALKRFLSEPDETYINDSFEIDSIILDDYPEEDYDIHKICQKL